MTVINIIFCRIVALTFTIHICYITKFWSKIARYSNCNKSQS